MCACQCLATAVDAFAASDEYRLLNANLGPKSMCVVGPKSMPLLASSAMAGKAVHLYEGGGVTAGRGSDCGLRLLGDESLGTMHMRIHTGPLSSIAEHPGAGGATYLRGRRVRLALLLPEDILWLGLSGAPPGLQYRVKGLCSIESRSNASTGGPSVLLEPGARGLDGSLKLPRSPVATGPALLTRVKPRGGLSLGTTRFQLTYGADAQPR